LFNIECKRGHLRANLYNKGGLFVFINSLDTESVLSDIFNEKLVLFIL